MLWRCGHCKNLAPEYAKAAKALEGSPVKLAKVDATENEALAKEFQIKGFPTLKFMKNGKPSEYNGGRTANEIVNWLNKKTGPAAVTVTSEDDLVKMQEKHEAFAIGVFDSVDSDSAKAFMAMADADELNTYAISTSAEVKSKLAVEKDSVVVLKDFDEKRNDHTVGDSFDAEAVQKFVTTSSIPLVQTFSAENAKKIFGSPIQQHFLFFTDKEASYHAETVAAYTAAAAEFKGKLLFVNVPSSENKILDYFGISAKDLPAAVLADLGSESGIKKYPFKGPHTSADLIAFGNSFVSGSLQPTLKSEEVQPEDSTGDVVVLRGNSFADLVLNNDKDVLVEFYAPWCGHCKKLGK